MIIAIGGISNAGKSKLASRIANYYKDQLTIVLCQDNYANQTPAIPKINGHTNWEIPESINFNKFYDKIVGSAALFDIVIAEGLFVFYESRLVSLYDKSIYLSINRDTFIDRKKNDLRWGKEPEWYMQHIWDSHFKFCNEIPSRGDAFQISGEEPVDFDSVIRFIES